MDINKLFSTVMPIYTSQRFSISLSPHLLYSDFYIFASLVIWSDALFYLAFSWLFLRLTIYSDIISHLYFCVCELSWNIYLNNFHWKYISDQFPTSKFDYEEFLYILDINILLLCSYIFPIYYLSFHLLWFFVI